MASGVYEFGEFRLDCGRYELTRRGRAIRLERKPMELLMLLAASGGQLITRAEIAERLWDNEVFVDTEHGINTAVRKIRQVLGDDSDEPRFIQTVTGMGYRFVAAVVVVESGSNVAESTAEQDAVPDQSAVDVPLPVQESAEGIGRSVRSRLRIGIASGGVVVIGLILAAAFGGRTLLDRVLHRNAKAPIRSLAVIPLDNFSGDAAQDYFADGMTDELTTMLAKDSTLRIVSRTSAMQFKGAHKPLAEIARALGVDGIVEGSVARTGGQVHMTLQLISADTDSHLWAESYDRSPNDVGALPGDAARAIARYLGSSTPVAATVRYVNPDAHDAYMRGHYLWFRGKNEEADEEFKKAVALQPDYAPGWAGLSEYYGQGVSSGWLDPAQALPLTESSAQKSVDLDDTLAEGHMCMGVAVLLSRWDMALAMKEMSRAIDLDPQYVQAIHFRARLLSLLGRHDEAIATQKRADEIDPFERPWAKISMLDEARRFDEALDESHRLFEADRGDGLWGLDALAYRSKGMWDEWAKSTAIGLDAKSATAFLRAFKQGGQQAAVRWQIKQLEGVAKTRYVSPMNFALLYAQLGDREKTLNLLEQGVGEHSPLLLEVQFDPAYDFLHADQRYRAVIKAIGLPPAY